MADELDQRVRDLEAERMRPAPPPPPPAARPAEPVPTDENAEANRQTLADETRAATACRIHAETGSLRAVMDRLRVSYAEARRLTEEAA